MVDAGESDGWSVRIPSDEACRFQYRVRPYLGKATHEDLEARLDDILRNIYCFTPDCKIGPLPRDRGCALWMQKLVDLQVELYRRGIDIEEFGGFESMPWNARALELMRKNMPLTAWQSRAGLFCKYGEERWLRLAQERGQIRLAPASYYRGAEHNTARHDDELTLRTYVTPYDYDLGWLHESMLRVIPPRGWGTLVEHKPSDHLIYCVTVRFDFRFFFDFGTESGPAEACLVVRDQDAFEQRLVASVSNRLPGWSIRLDAVHYVDPYTLIAQIGWAGQEMYLFKPFRYMYQGEHRLIAVPPPGHAEALTHVDIEVGSLQDISELLLLQR
jgi:hypothetical protein